LKLLEQAKKELYPGCKNATNVSFIVKLFQIKCMYGLSNTALEAILKLFGMVLLEGIVFLTPWIKCKGLFETWAWTMSRNMHAKMIVCYFLINTQI
jgi:hypothetical protein